MHPVIRNPDVALVIETCPVRADELTGHKSLPRLGPQRVVPGRCVRVAQVLDDAVVAIHQGDPPDDMFVLESGLLQAMNLSTSTLY